MKTVSLRLPSNVKQLLGKEAIRMRSSASQITRDSLRPYLNGSKRLPQVERPEMVKTTVTLDPKEVDDFAELAKAAGLPFDEAMRFVIAEHLVELAAPAAPTAVQTNEHPSLEE